MILLKEKYPTLFLQLKKENNDGIDLNLINHGSNKILTWQCPIANDHIWDRKVCDRVAKQGCPFCLKRKVCLSNCLATSNPELVPQWHSINIMTPYQLTDGSTHVAIWVCEKGHIWEREIRFRAKNKKQGCPYCSNAKVCVDNCLMITHPELCKEWHPVNDISPYHVVSGSAIKVLWICEKGHVWAARITTRACEGKGCVVCGNETKSEKMINLMQNGWEGYKSKYKHGKFYSKKNNKELYFRSSYEEDVFNILENDDLVLNYRAESIKIPYKKDGQLHISNYLVDLEVKYKTHIMLLEIKPINLLFNAKTFKNIKEKILAAVLFCKQNNNMKYKIWSENKIRKLKFTNIMNQIN